MTRGFTLLELIIVIIIVGILASLALPQYVKVIEKARAAEGISMLGAIRSAQARYYGEKAAFATSLNDLDVSFPNAKFFTIPTTLNPTLGTGANVAHITRNGVNNSAGTYTIQANYNGSYICSDTNCSKAGISSAW